MNNYIVELVFMIFALVIVSILAWLILRAFKKFYVQKSQHSPIKIQSVHPIGTREKIMVMEYRDKEYILGVTPSNISLIDKTTLSNHDTPKQD